MSTTTVPHQHDNIIPGDDVEPGHLFTPEQQAERAAEFRARCPRVILSPAQRRRAAREQRRYLRQALTREAAERTRSAATALAALRPRRRAPCWAGARCRPARSATSSDDGEGPAWWHWQRWSARWGRP